VEPGDRTAFDGILAEIFGAIDKPLSESKRDAFWKGLQRMGIVELSRCRDHILAKLETEEPPKSFGVAHVWDAKRALRAKGAPQQIRQPDEPEANPWELQGTRFLQGYLNRNLQADPMRYGRPATAAGMARLSRERFPHADASEDFVRNIERLVAAKKAWVADMIDQGGTGPVDVDLQKSVWRDYFERAEAEISQRMAA